MDQGATAALQVLAWTLLPLNTPHSCDCTPCIQCTSQATKTSLPKLLPCKRPPSGQQEDHHGVLLTIHDGNLNCGAQQLQQHQRHACNTLTHHARQSNDYQPLQLPSTTTTLHHLFVLVHLAPCAVHQQCLEMTQ